MPFLFVDYDQGAGGEFFCSNISRSLQCVPLTSQTFDNNRTKVIDCFEHEFLKPSPKVRSQHCRDERWEIVPSHRHTDLAAELNLEFGSIRIAMPTDPMMWKFVKQQQISKVLLSQEPNDAYFFGLVRILAETSNSYEWVKNINRGMDNLSLILLSRGLEVTEESRQQYIDGVAAEHQDEPDFDYDYVIPYETLINDPVSVQIGIKDIFGITIEDLWLETYQKNYETYLAQT